MQASTPVAGGGEDLTEGALIEVGGRSRFLRCTGQEEPTVIFDAGYSADSSAWAAVEPAIAKMTRTCVWDRAATGRSAATSPARGSGDAVADLHALLQAAGVAPPYVLVGHSYGGQNVRLFASSYPDEVSGLVLVDALHEEYFERLRELDPAQKEALQGMLASIPEAVDFAASSKQLRDADPLPDVPAVVITRGTVTFPPEEPTAATEALWRELQRDLVSRLPRAELVVAKRSGHNVPADQPEVVIAAIEQVVEAVRVMG